MRTYFLLPLVVVLMGLSPVGPTFSDVSWDHPNIDAIRYLAGEEVVSGYPDGTFKPDALINRAEFTKIAVSAMFTEQAWTVCDPNNIYSFHDASRTEWYSPFLCVAVQSKVIQGYADGTFRPTRNISFAEAAKILVEADRQDEGGNPRYDRSLPTVSGPWYASYVLYLQNHEAIPLSITRVDQLITRGEMAEMIYRLKAGVTYKQSQTWANLNTTHTTSSTLYTEPTGLYSITVPAGWTVEKDDNTYPEQGEGVSFSAPIPVDVTVDKVWLHIGILPTCQGGKPLGFPSGVATQNVTLNGTVFATFNFDEGAMGGADWKHTVYEAALKQGTCISMETEYQYHLADFALDTPDPAADKRQSDALAAFQSQLDAMARTLITHGATQTSNDTQTYNDPQNLYSLTYPSTWTAGPRPDDSNVIEFSVPNPDGRKFVESASIDVLVPASCPPEAPGPGTVVQTVSLGGHTFIATELADDFAAGTVIHEIDFTSSLVQSKCLVLKKIINITNDNRLTAQEQTLAAEELSTMQDTLKNVLKTIVIH